MIVPIWEVFAGILALAFAAGLLGALLGLGGGLIIVPGLVILFGIDVHLAIAASLVSIIANSSGSASRYARQGQINLRLGMFLEIATAAGGVIGAVLTTTLLTGSTGTTILLVSFVPVTLAAAILLRRNIGRHVAQTAETDPLAERWRLSGSFRDNVTGETVEYKVLATKKGLMASLGAGLISGLIGIGGGIFKVPAMNVFMRVPMKVASATSSLMIGVTAGGGALIFLLRGYIAPLLVAPVAIGALAGSFTGTLVHSRSSSDTLKTLFVMVLIAAAIIMALKAVGVLATA
jgi:hypothetical protein